MAKTFSQIVADSKRRALASRMVVARTHWSTVTIAAVEALRADGVPEPTANLVEPIVEAVLEELALESLPMSEEEAQREWRDWDAEQHPGEYEVYMAEAQQAVDSRTANKSSN